MSSCEEPATGGMHALLARETMAGLGANDNGGELSRRLEAKARLRHGGIRRSGTPEVAFGLTNAEREISFGWRLNLARRKGDLGSQLALALEATRRESRSAEQEPEHGVGLRFALRW